MSIFGRILSDVREVSIDIVDAWVEQRLIDQRIRTFSCSRTAHAGVEESFVCAVVLAVVDLGALALRTNVLYGLGVSPQHLHIGACEWIMWLEEEISAVVLLEAFGCSCPWLFDPLEVSSIVIVVDVGEKIATMQPVVAMCLGLDKRLLLSTSVDEGSSGVLWGTRTWREHGNMTPSIHCP